MSDREERTMMVYLDYNPANIIHPLQATKLAMILREWLPEPMDRDTTRFESIPVDSLSWVTGEHVLEAILSLEIPPKEEGRWWGGAICVTGEHNSTHLWLTEHKQTSPDGLKMWLMAENRDECDVIWRGFIVHLLLFFAVRRFIGLSEAKLSWFYRGKFYGMFWLNSTERITPKDSDWERYHIAIVYVWLISEAVFGAEYLTVYMLTHLCPPLRSTFAVRGTASLGIMGEPRVPPLNPSETIVLSEHYRLWGV